MPSAEIRINQPGGPGTGSPGISRDDLLLHTSVELRNVDDNGVQRWFWSLLDKPPGSTATIANPNSAVATFTPDVYGTYRIYLRVNDGRGRRGMEVVRTAIVRDPAGFRPPAYLEGVDSNFQLSPGVFNEVGGLHEVRRRMTSLDNRDNRYAILGLAGGGGLLDFDIDWPLPDAHVVWLEMSSTATTAVFLSIYANAARTERVFDSGVVNPLTGWFYNVPFVATRTQARGLENGKIYFTVENDDVLSDIYVGWRIQAL